MRYNGRGRDADRSPIPARGQGVQGLGYEQHAQAMVSSSHPALPSAGQEAMRGMGTVGNNSAEDRYQIKSTIHPNYRENSMEANADGQNPYG